MEPIACLLFYLVIKMESTSHEDFYKKPFQTWPAAVKTFKKHQNAPV